MRLLFIITLLLSIATSAISQNDLAHVKQFNGLYVFTDCTPASEYEAIGRVSYIGAEKSRFVYSNGIAIPYSEKEQYTRLRNSMVTLALGNSLEVEGVIISITSEGQGYATTIKFKNKDEDHSLAKVNSINGIFIFTDCVPVSKYKVLGQKGRLLSSSSEYSHIRDRLTKLCSQRYSKTEGVILTLVDGGRDKAEAIEFAK